MTEHSAAMVQQAWTKSVDEVVAAAGVDTQKGLDQRTVKNQRRQYGRNQLREIRSRAWWRILLDQLKSIVVLLLLAAAVAASLFGLWLEAAAVGAAIVVNTFIGFAMEWRATRAMEALQRMGRISARVLREAQSREIEAEDLVPGDILLLEAGDVIAADVRLLEANALQCNESALTGESVAVDKQVDTLSAAELPPGDRINMAFKGTAVTRGSASGIVVATGMATELGSISSMVEDASSEITPLEKRLDALGRRLIWLTLAVAAVVAGAGFIAGKDPVVMLETAIALAIAAVPEGLPVVATLALAQGMRRMARHNAVVKRLSAVEALGAASLIFTDKTGTLTEDRMTLSALALQRGTLRVNDADDENHRHRQAGFRLDGETLDAGDTADLLAALEVGALCNNASLEENAGVGDPTEVAFLKAAAVAELSRDSLLEKYPEQREISFDPELKMMATFHAQDGHYRVAVKGAPEAVIDICSHVLNADGESLALDDEARRIWHERSEKLAADGLRMLVLAQKQVDDKDAEPYKNLTLLGLAGLYDPPRAGIKEAIARCQQAGIRVIMGTGDHAATARAIAMQIGLDDSDTAAVESTQLKELNALSEEQRREFMAHAVFARISPRQKLDLIRSYQQAGWVVGMTGDGVNDAPALKQADIGIAMGQRGSEVAREAADMVLKDDAFATIIIAIEHGRSIFQNIRRFIIYLLSGNLGEIMAISAAALVAAPLPMLPLQILYINFVSDVMPALALGLSQSERNVMQQKPRDVKEPFLLHRHWLAIIGYASLIAAAVLGAFAVALNVLQLPTAEAVSIAFLTFGFTRLWHVFNMRSPDSALLINEISSTPFVWIAISIGIALLLAAVYVPLLAGVLSIQAPDIGGWLLILSFSLLPLLLIQLMKIGRIGWEAG